MATAVSENTGERFGISGGAMLTYSVSGCPLVAGALRLVRV